MKKLFTAITAMLSLTMASIAHGAGLGSALSEAAQASGGPATVQSGPSLSARQLALVLNRWGVGPDGSPMTKQLVDAGFDPATCNTGLIDSWLTGNSFLAIDQGPHRGIFGMIIPIHQDGEPIGGWQLWGTMLPMEKNLAVALPHAFGPSVRMVPNPGMMPVWGEIHSYPATFLPDEKSGDYGCFGYQYRIERSYDCYMVTDNWWRREQAEESDHRHFADLEKAFQTLTQNINDTWGSAAPRYVYLCRSGTATHGLGSLPLNRWQQEGQHPWSPFQARFKPYIFHQVSAVFIKENLRERLMHQYNDPLLDALARSVTKVEKVRVVGVAVGKVQNSLFGFTSGAVMPQDYFLAAIPESVPEK
ncbi:MAG: hypothetical protein RE468_08915 [Acidithiobacillus caldus]|uniref:Uncharacterized protein n=1 Tax=Acidithiobacillus caldus TaxID=33059 RepID=A0A1E7YQN4_9PROT|nr:hypothetical protein [Acidithiobacillus caldus]MBU2802175.1 hypothetical protein [Acidithiobacillus caldus]OFC38281.1 hypothetical protein BAE27_02420 [Acidithiobacillus caldus]OFC38695.1 hypothetical protein BAE28_04915 [Acidithiobacillus caldus]OFC41231.1 hypothetical protein BAE29_03350 [Acidithiobacillus caldus]WMT46029.1 MAG: hypothetical protein RE468_08915 [Acidithiobacillus caldus]